MSKWNELSMAEKAEMMKVAVRQGITNLSDIRQRYNEFAEGGSEEEEEEVNTEKDYINTMERVAEENYRKWGYDNSDEALLHALNDNTYNYRGYYEKYPQSAANADTHWPDEFKTVYHPTFSRESIYSGKKSQYNPNGRVGGLWLSEDLFVPAPWQLFSNYAEGGPIHIKPENRGKFTALKERTGHSATWFKEHGTPAQKKMATFALNARHWKHEDGGNLYEEGGLLDWIKNIFSSDSRKYKAADGKVFNTAEDAAKHNSSLVKQGRLYQQMDSKSLRVRRKLVPRKPNTSSTSLKSTILENSMYLGLDANRERTGYRTKAYDIPYGTKEIRVKPKGTTLPFNVSVNALDSIAKYAGVTGTPIQTALGLPYQETTFGRNPLINYESLGDKYSATDLGNANYFKAFGSIPAEYLVRDFRYNGDLLIDGKRDEPIPMDTPPLQHAFEYFNAGKYNTKANNHTGKVKAAGNAFWNETTGSLQNWWNTEGKEWYNKGAKQIKR